MASIAIMTDSNSGIMPSEGIHYGIHVLPMPVIIDGETYSEGIDISLDKFFRRQREGAVISTSQPSPGDVSAMWDELLGSHDEVVFIPMSSGLSSTCQTAMLLAEEEPYKGRVFVADNHRISVTQGIAALEARNLADAGKSAAEIKQILSRSVSQSKDILINSLPGLVAEALRLRIIRVKDLPLFHHRTGTQPFRSVLRRQLFIKRRF